MRAASITDWRAYFHASGGSGFVYVKDAAMKDKVHELLQRLKQDPANGIREIWTRRAARRAWARTRTRRSASTSWTGSTPASAPTPSSNRRPRRGGHGFAADRPALHASFILTGPSVRQRGSLGVIRMTRIAPTLARILGVSLSPAAAEPLPIASH